MIPADSNHTQFGADLLQMPSLATRNANLGLTEDLMEDNELPAKTSKVSNAPSRAYQCASHSIARLILCAQKC